MECRYETPCQSSLSKFGSRIAWPWPGARVQLARDEREIDVSLHVNLVGIHGVIILPSHTLCIILREIPQNYHTFLYCLIHPNYTPVHMETFQNDFAPSHGKKSFSSTCVTCRYWCNISTLHWTNMSHLSKNEAHFRKHVGRGYVGSEKGKFPSWSSSTDRKTIKSTRGHYIPNPNNALCLR